MSILRFTIMLFVMVIMGCYSTTQMTEGRTMKEEQVLEVCRARWGWEGLENAFGVPTVKLERLDVPLLSKKMTRTTAYRVTYANRDFVFGSGPKTRTVACLVDDERVTFLENDVDVQKVIRLCNTQSIDGAVIFELIMTYAKLRGFEVQIGSPSEKNPWVVVVKDGRYPLLMQPHEQDPKRWTLVIDRSESKWTAEFTLVSPDDFSCYRYTIHIKPDGYMEILLKEKVFSLGAHI